MQVLDGLDRWEGGEEEKAVGESAPQRIRREDELRDVPIEDDVRPEERRHARKVLVTSPEQRPEMLALLVGGRDQNEIDDETKSECGGDRPEHQTDSNGADGRKQIERIPGDRIGPAVTSSRFFFEPI